MKEIRKTKIICTLGPSTDEGDVLRQLMLAGMNVARFNFSHGTHEEQKARLDRLVALRNELKLPVATLLDTKGPGDPSEGAEGRLRDSEGRADVYACPWGFCGEIPTGVAITYEDLYKDVHVGEPDSDRRWAHRDEGCPD